MAWLQIEKTLYKFKPGKAKAFSMWTQITRNVSLAYVKKHNRDFEAIRKLNRDGKATPMRSLYYWHRDMGRKPDLLAIMEDLRSVTPTDDHDMIDAILDRFWADDEAWYGLKTWLTKRFGRTRTVRFYENIEARKGEVSLTRVLR